jgi:hypothetical protein
MRQGEYFSVLALRRLAQCLYIQIHFATEMLIPSSANGYCILHNVFHLTCHIKIWKDERHLTCYVI